MNPILARAAIAALIAVFSAHAAAPPSPSAPPSPPAAPGGGTILQDLKPIEPPAPSQAEPGLTIEQPGEGKPPPTPPFFVKSIRIVGNTSFDASTLHALIADAEGRELTLPELNSRVARITDFYRSHGFPLARALIPAQTIRDGEVEVEVIEARYGKIALDNRGRVSDALLRATLAPLQSGGVIEQGQLDHVLLLLSDVPGMAQSATLAPGAATGTSDLLVQATPGPMAAGVVTLDNYGNRYTRSERAGGEVALDDPAHHGDVLDANIETSGKEMNYGRLSYDVLLNGEGTHAGAAYSALNYILGQSLEKLEGRGTAQVASLWVKQPFLRTPDLNIYGQLQFDRKELHDDIDVSDIHTHRHLDNGTAGLAGDWRDALFSGGTGSFSIQWVRGAVGFENFTAESADARTARTEGPFSQWDATVGRVQRLGAQDALSISLTGQGANRNLDPSQKMVAGGRYTVRSYDMSAVSGDTGVQGSVELRHDLKGSKHGQWQATAFLDGQHVAVNREVWTSGKNDATLRGAGIGLNWTSANQWTAKVAVAKRLGTAPVLAGDESQVRGWLEISKGFQLQ